MKDLRIILGDRVLPVNLGAARVDPMLWAQAQSIYAESPAGSVLELRAALVIVGLVADPLRAATLALAGATGYDVPRLGGAVYGLLEGAGVAPGAALEGLRALLNEIKERSKPPEVKPDPKPEARSSFVPEIPDPYPGLTRREETYPVFAVRTAGKRSLDVENERTEWRAAGIAHEGGRIASWVAEVGAALGFVYEAPPTSGPSSAG